MPDEPENTEEEILIDADKGKEDDLVDKKAFESLSPDEREMIQSGEGKIVDGEFKVSINAFRKRLGRETQKRREHEERLVSMEAALEAVRNERGDKKGADEFDDGYTDEQLDELVAQGNLKLPAQIIAARTFRDLRKKERENESNSWRENAWRNQVRAGDERAKQKYPQLNQDSDSFDPEFAGDVMRTAVKNGYIYFENNDPKKVVYLNPEAVHLAAEEVAQSNPKYKKPAEKASADALNEKIRQQRLKGSEMDKGKADAGAGKPSGPKPTKADYETAKKFNIPVDSILKYKNKSGVTV